VYTVDVFFYCTGIVYLPIVGCYRWQTSTSNKNFVALRRTFWPRLWFSINRWFQWLTRLFFSLFYYFSIRYNCLLLCSTTWFTTMVDVLVLYVCLSSFLLCTLANICIGKATLWKVSYFIWKSLLFYFVCTRMDCTEAQFSFIVTYILSILFPNLWSKTVCLLDLLSKYRIFNLLNRSQYWTSNVVLLLLY